MTSRRNYKQEEPGENIFSATIGIVFFGTPHDTSSPLAMERYCKNLARITDPVQSRKDIDLRRFRALLDGENLVTLPNVIALLEDGRITVVSFFETSPMMTEAGPLMVGTRAKRPI